jgi:hypothetical protein
MSDLVLTRASLPGSFTSAVAALLLVGASASLAHAGDDIKLSSNQRISCNRGLMQGRLQTSTCRSYAYIFNAKTSEYYRCTAGVTVTKDNKELMKIDTEGGCQKRMRAFPNDSSYSFDGAETEGPNTNSFFGPGGYVMWVSDNTQLAAKACFTIAVSGVEKEVDRCVDMKFE